MAHMDVFNDSAFSMMELTAAVNEIPRLPGLIGNLGLFTPRPIRTSAASFEEKDGKLTLIETTQRGAPLPRATRETRKLRYIRAPRIAKADSLRAEEIAGIRAFGSESELMQVQDEVAARLAALNRDMQLTWEHMRLGAIQGIVLDADGTTPLYNLFDEFGVSQPGAVDFDLDNASPAEGALRKKCSEMVRAVKNAAQNAWIEGSTYVAAVVDDVFWDQLIAHKEVRETYKNWIAAAELRGDASTGVFRFGGIEWHHYEGTDGSANTSTVKVPSGTAKFFPVNGAPDLFEFIPTPGEFLDAVNRPGLPMYALTIPDTKRNAFVDIELYSYPLFVCTRPLVLRRATNT